MGKQIVTEAMRRAYRDRTLYLGDPDFVKMPIARLTSDDYAAGLRASILPDKATPSSMLPGANPPLEGVNTTPPMAPIRSCLLANACAVSASSVTVAVPVRGASWVHPSCCTRRLSKA